MVERTPRDDKPDDPLPVPGEDDETHAPHEETEDLDKSDWPPPPG
jgi:hypothetical protein